MLHLWCQGAALLPALLFESLYSGFSGGLRTSFLHSIILNRPTADNSSLAFPSAAERCFFILIAALHSVSLRLQRLNQKTLTEYHRFFSESFHGFVFWFFLFDFLLTWIVPWQDKWDFRRIFLLIVPWQDKGDFRRIRLLILSAY